MATVAGPVKQSSAPKNDAFVEGQLDRARRRIRLLDVVTALLGLLAGTLAFGLVMAVLDSWLELSPLARGVSFGLYVVAAAVYLGFTLVLPLSRRINPYYAARKVEETIPDAKNSVVNWLDLHDDKRLPGPIHQAVSQKAARDLARVDLDQALSGRRAGWAGGAVGILFVFFLVVLFSLGYRKFFSHLGRAFLFGSGAAATSTLLEIVEPEGDVTVSADQPVLFRVRVGGKIPPAVQLLTQPTKDDPETPWAMEESPGERSLWEVTVPGQSVKNGFYYRVVGGDAETATHRLSVRASPTIYQERFVAHYKQRPYTGQKVERIERKQRDLNDLRGTEVKLVVPTNRQLREGRMEILNADGTKELVPATIDANDRQRMRLAFVLKQSGQYVLRFTSSENEPFSDSLGYKITARADTAPKVELKKPGQNVAEPADGQVQLEAVASDDIGVGELRLRIKVVDREELAAQPYRNKQEIQLPDGGYPHVLDYLHTLDLAKLKDGEGRPYPLKVDQELEYWLEAKDACDFQVPNVGESQRFRIKITPPKQNPKEKEEQRKRAEEKQKEHEKKQDDKRKEENKERQEKARQEKERQEKEAREQPNQEPERNPGKNGPKNQKPEAQNPKEGKPDNANDGKDKAEQKPQDKATEQKMNEADKEARDRAQKERNEQKANAKDDPSKEKKGECKDGDKGSGEKSGEKGREGKAKPNPDDKQQGGEDRGKEGQQDGKPDEKRGEGKQGKPDQQTGESKDGKGDGMKDEKATAKDGGEKQGQPQERGEAKGKPEKQAGKGKEGGKPEEKQGEGKQAGKPEMNDPAKGEKKDGQQAGSEKKDNPAAGKDGARQNEAENRGQGKPSGQKETGDKAGEKKDGQQADGMKDNPGQGKETGDKSEPTKKGEGKGELKKTAAGQAKEAPKGQKEQTAGQGKAGPKDDMKGQTGEEKGAGKGEEKTAQKKDDAVKGDGEKGEDRSAEKATKEDVEKLTRAIKSDDPKERQEARRKLEEISKEGTNGDARQAAEKEVEKQKAEDQKQAVEGLKKLVEDLKSDDAKKREDAKKALEEVAKQAREAKPDESKDPPENKELPKEVKDALEELQKDAKSDDPKKREAAQRAVKALEEAAKEAEKNKKPKQGGNPLDDLLKEYIGGKDRQTDDKDAKFMDPKSDNRHRTRAGDLRWENFDKNDPRWKKALKDLKVTEQEAEAIKDLVNRRPELKKEPDGTAKIGPGKSLPTEGPGRVKNAGDAKDIGTSDKGQPPPEYRDAFKEFSKRFGDQKKDK